MAFNWQTFRTRALTAIVFVVVMLVGLLWNHWSFLVLFSVIHFGCWLEYFKLVEKIYTTYFHIYTKLGLMLIGYGLMLWFCGPAYNIAGYGLKENFSLPVSAAGFFLLLVGIFQKYKVELKPFGAAALGLLYISLSWGLMMDLYEITVYKKVAETIRSGSIVNGAVGIFTIGCMWINDTMAYVVGSLIGKTPFSKISPKKTWEGTVGGIILCTVIMGFVMHDFMYRYYSLTVNSISQNHWYTIAAIAAIAGTYGDLLESKLKRMADVKDSGQIMPGHGGFLDRFDSLVFATPFVWLYVNFFMR
jgi:phosphatidate cytidylyltransferase